MGAGTTGQSGKDIELHVAEATGKNVDLDAQVNHKVELVGTMSSKDLAAIKGGKTGAGGQSGSGTGYGSSSGSSTTGTGTGTTGTGTSGTGTSSTGTMTDLEHERPAADVQGDVRQVHLRQVPVTLFAKENTRG